MHFTVPSTEEICGANGGTYVVYYIHINGSLHCRLRYRQLHVLHEQLKKRFGSKRVPSFPSKKILKLTSDEIEERRINLEHYLQLISQDNLISVSEVLNGFLAAAQLETQITDENEIDLDLYLLNNYKFTIKILSTLQTDDVLEKACKHLNLNTSLVHYFGIFLMKKEQDKYVLVKKLYDCEAPYISLQSVTEGPYHLVIKKNYWDIFYDKDLLSDKVGLNLLYAQTIAEVEWGWIIVPNPEMQVALSSLQAKGNKEEYIKMAQKLKYYGYSHFEPCICNYPESNTPAEICIGNKELNIRIPGSQDSVKEGSFKVTRIKCWRITTNCDSNDDQSVELSIEYLMAKNELKWITITSPQAIFMSICLQGLVEELVRKKKGLSISQPGDKIYKISYSYMNRDGITKVMTGRAGFKEEYVNSDTGMSFKKLSNKFAQLNLVGKLNSGSQCNVENNAFEEIGDDEL